MKINTMRNIDRFAGIPLCWFLGFIVSLFCKLRIKQSYPGAKNILVIKFFGMGSILLSTPALSLMRQAFPNAQLWYLSFETNRELIERLPVVDRVLTIRTSTFAAFLSDTLKVITHTRRITFDIVFDFEFFSKFSTVIAGLTNAPYRLGFSLPTQWRKRLLTHQVSLLKENHVTKAFCELVFTMSSRISVPPLVPPTITHEDVQSLNNKIHLNGNSIICVNVNAGETFLERRWLPEQFAELVDRLSAEKDREFFFIGSGEECEYVQNVIELTSVRKRCYNLAGVLSIPELAALFKHCDMIISNDSGPVHLAAALGTPMLALYGPETPQFYGPIGDNVSIIYKRVSCSPCMNLYDAKTFRCPYSALCMREISVAEVEEKVETVCAEYQ
ncbi:MAG: glycosyltransferase family 9 protein [Ignavibacteriae bacterium]|nr:glycosyltransferase family 9 protein [Ignavibacteriota bacterium]